MASVINNVVENIVDNVDTLECPSTLPDNSECSSTLPDYVNCHSTVPENVECPSPVPDNVACYSSVPDDTIPVAPPCSSLPGARSCQVKVEPAGRRCGCSFPCLTSWLLLLLLLAVTCVLATLLETLNTLNSQKQVMALSDNLSLGKHPT